MRSPRARGGCYLPDLRVDAARTLTGHQTSTAQSRLDSISGGFDVRRHPHPKTVVVVPVVRIVPVAVGAARVAVFIVERTAAQHAGVSSVRPFTAEKVPRV